MPNNRYTNLTAEDYRDSYSELEDYCINNTNLNIFGEFGNASCPGISDLDVLISLEDKDFASDREKIIHFINQNKTRKYLFFHDPLILPNSILPYLKKFHTCYNLTTTFNKSKEQVGTINDVYTELLNRIWTTFLLCIGPKILLENKYEDRDYLLVYKNICQSIDNIDPSLEALELSKTIRKEFLRGEKDRKDIIDAFKKELNHLFEISDDILDSYTCDIKLNKTLRLGRNKYFYISEKNTFKISNDKVIIYLSKGLFNALHQFYYRKTNNKLLDSYINDSLKINRLCNKFGTPYPFVSPFAYGFYRTDLKFYLKKKILSL
jgi:hypothetical protein